jgi:hypothetical protein
LSGGESRLAVRQAVRAAASDRGKARRGRLLQKTQKALASTDILM